MTSAQAAEQMGCCVETVVRLANRGQLRGFKVGRRWRFTPEHLEALLVEVHELPERAPQVPIGKPPAEVPWAGMAVKPASTKPTRPRHPRGSTVRDRIKALDPYASAA